VYDDAWRTKWVQGFGPFSYVSAGGAKLTIPVAGPCAFVVGGGKKGGRVVVRDKHSGFEASPEVQPEGDHTQVLGVSVPGAVMYRELELEFEEGTRLFALQTGDRQPILSTQKFSFASLPPVGD
jgi:hypothetical protein